MGIERILHTYFNLVLAASQVESDNSLLSLTPKETGESKIVSIYLLHKAVPFIETTLLPGLLNARNVYHKSN